MAVRHRVHEYTGPGTSFLIYVYRPDGSLSQIIPASAAGALQNSSDITDTIRLRRYVKPVGHTKRSIRWEPNPSRMTFGNGWSQVYQPAPEFITNNAIRIFTASHVPLGPSGAAVASLTDAALRALSDQVPQEVDLVNFVLDLGEMGSLIPSLAENMARTVSGGYLSYAFGWKPFIGDLRKLGHLNQIVADRLKWLRDTRGREVRLGFSSDWPYEGPETMSIEDSSLTLISSRRQFVAGAYLFHLLERLEGMEGNLRAFSSALGLLNPSAVVWERIPFSFVADWFVRTDGIVNSLQLQPFSGLWNLRNISHSFYYKEEWEIKSTRSDVAEFLGQLQATLVVETYTRGPGLPVSSSVLTETSLTPQQLVLAAALLGAATK